MALTLRFIVSNNTAAEEVSLSLALSVHGEEVQPVYPAFMEIPAMWCVHTAPLLLSLCLPVPPPPDVQTQSSVCSVSAEKYCIWQNSVWYATVDFLTLLLSGYLMHSSGPEDIFHVPSHYSQFRPCFPV